MLQDPDALAELSELMKDPTFKARIDAFTTSEAAPKNQVSAVLQGRQVPDYEAVPSDDAEDADVDAGQDESQNGDRRERNEVSAAAVAAWHQTAPRGGFVDRGALDASPEAAAFDNV